jgi:thiol-disulfide isomerase/thioredoxin
MATTLSVGISGGAGWADDPGLPAVEQVFAGYAANRDAFHTLHVVLTEKSRYTDDWAACQQAQIERMDAAGKRTDIPETVRKELLEQAENLRAITAALRDGQRQSTEFFTNRSACQFRQPLAFPAPEDWTFPQTPLSPESLLAEYAACRILTLAPQAAPAVRLWQGAPRAGLPPQKTISNKRLEELGTYRFPPLGAASFDWTTPATRGPVDEFFAGEPGEYNVVRYETVDGRRLLIVERRTDFEQPFVQQQADGSHQASTLAGHRLVRAWLDPARGWLPLRCEFRTAVEYGGKPVDPADAPPHQVLDVTGIEAVNGGGFYPVAGEAKSMGPRPDAPPVTLQSLRDGSAAKVELVVHQIDGWEATVVEAGLRLPGELFLPEFPPDSVVYDLDENKVLGALEPRPPLKASERAPELEVAAWLDGESRTLASLRGRVVVLDFWGVWCGPCRQIVPGLKDLHEIFRDRPVTFISLHTAGAKPDDVAAFLKDQSWECMGAIDRGTMIEDSATANLYGVGAFPTLVVIDPEGVVAYNSGRELEEDRDVVEARLKADAEQLGFPWPLDKDADAEVVQERMRKMFVHELRREIERVVPQ